MLKSPLVHVGLIMYIVVGGLYLSKLKSREFYIFALKVHN